MSTKDKAPKFTREHYEFIAEAIADFTAKQGADTEYTEVTMRAFAWDLAVKFDRDNPLFSAEQFIKASGF